MGLDMYLYAKSKNDEVENVGYWRKANAIHGWFVRELANGVDECQVIEVPRARLEELRGLCLKTLSQKPVLVAAGNQNEAGATAVLQVEEGQSITDIIKQEWDIQTHEHEFNNSDDNDPLRPTGGFFFGSTERDEWYYEDLAETVRIIDNALSLGEEWEYEYQASW